MNNCDIVAHQSGHGVALNRSTQSLHRGHNTLSPSLLQLLPYLRLQALRSLNIHWPKRHVLLGDCPWRLPGKSKKFDSYVYIRTYGVKLVLYLHLSIPFLYCKSFKSSYIFIILQIFTYKGFRIIQSLSPLMNEYIVKKQ